MSVEAESMKEDTPKSERVSERDLLDRFEEIQKFLKEVEKRYGFPTAEESTPQRGDCPFVVEPIFYYEVHSSV